MRAVLPGMSLFFAARGEQVTGIEAQIEVILERAKQKYRGGTADYL